MALPANFLDELRARTPIAAVIGKAVKLTRSGRDNKGCCPFHGEKTPSFYVYEDHFHCFGCGEHGDVISFLMKSSGAGFMEVVEGLAREAGLEVPKASPQAAQAEQRRAGILEVLEAAGKKFQELLFAPQGLAALEYLRGRGLGDETIRRFGLGWSGEGRGMLAGALRGQGIKPEQLIEAGLMKQSERGPVDMFFSRIMFPIRDARGSMLSFGGRVMGDGQPKYVNGPETEVFAKRRALYGLNFARDAVRKGATLIVVEGYMDVIALAQAGFGGAVAPLGTALTEEHLAQAWRLSPAPVICFDADNAGRRAALKTVDMALGALAADRSLKFLRLPEKDDPDSLIRREGARAFGARLEQAQPISAALFDMLAEGVVRSTPEARASFRNRLIETAGRIPDRSLASEYRRMLFKRLDDEWRGKGKAPARMPVFTRDAAPPDPAVAEMRRARLMLATLIAHPWLIPDVEEAFARVQLPAEEAALRAALSRFVAQAGALDTDSLLNHLNGLGLSPAAALVCSQAAQDHRPDAEASRAEIAEVWWGWYILMDFSLQMLRAQRDEAQRFCQANQEDRAGWDRLTRYNLLLRQAMAGEAEPEPAPN